MKADLGQNPVLTSLVKRPAGSSWGCPPPTCWPYPRLPPWSSSWGSPPGLPPRSSSWGSPHGVSPWRPSSPACRSPSTSLHPGWSPHWWRGSPPTMSAPSSLLRQIRQTHCSTPFTMEGHLPLLHELGVSWLLIWWPLKHKPNKASY